MNHKPFLYLLIFGWVVLALSWPAQSNSSEIMDGLMKGATVKITEIVDGDTVILDNGRQVRLMGIQAPKLPLNRPNFVAWPLAEEAKEYLEKILSHNATLYLADTAEDRHGRILAHIITDDGKWLQQEMLLAGLARVYSFADNHEKTEELYAAAKKARKDKRGLWQLAYYAIRKSDDPKLQDLTGRFEIVEGTIKNVAEVKKNYYLNFGDNWREDFTVFIPLSARKSFTAQKIKLKTWEGKKIRVRGWVENRNGPSIEVTHPEQIELLLKSSGS